MEVFLKLLTLWGVTVFLHLAVTLVLAGPLTLIWNWLIPDLFALPTIRFVQAWGLLVFIGILFSSVNVKLEVES